MKLRFNAWKMAFWALFNFASINFVYCQDQYPEYDIEFDFEIDICKINKICSAVDRLVDKGRRILGYDSSAYVRAKKRLNDRNVRLEMSLAVLTVLKYPSLYEPIDGIHCLDCELKAAFNSDEWLNSSGYILSAESLKIYAEIYNNLKELSREEFLALAWSVNDKAKFFSGQNCPTQENFLRPGIEQKIQDMLDSLLHEM